MKDRRQVRCLVVFVLRRVPYGLLVQ